MSDESTLALLHLARMHAEGELDEAQFNSAQEGLMLPPPPSSEEDPPIADDAVPADATPPEKAMPDDFKDYDYEAELPGNKALRSFHKALHSAKRCAAKALASVEEPDVRAHLGEHDGGITKALKAMGMLHTKKYKGSPPLPDDYPEEEENPLVTKQLSDDTLDGLDDDVGEIDGMGKALPGAMSGEDATAGGVLGVRPEDEEVADEMDDETFTEIKKSLPSLRRQLGLR